MTMLLRKVDSSCNVFACYAEFLQTLWSSVARTKAFWNCYQLSSRHSYCVLFLQC